MTSFTKKYLDTINQTARFVNVFERHGFEIKDAAHYQQIVSDLMVILNGGKKKRGPGRPAKNEEIVLVKRGPGRPKKAKRGRPKAAVTLKKGRRKPKVKIEKSIELA